MSFKVDISDQRRGEAMDKQPLKVLLFEICIAKQRLEHFKNDPIKSNDAADLLKQLFNLYDEVYKRSLAACDMPEEERFLLFTNVSPDGAIVTRDEYYESIDMMTNHDRDHHVLVPLYLGMVG